MQNDQNNKLWENRINENQKNSIFRNPNMHKAGGGMGDWLHINCMSELGPNKWYEKGDERFKPNNIIFMYMKSEIIMLQTEPTIFPEH